jgi:hypothetical protein
MCIHWQFQARSCLPEFWSENVNPELKRHTVCIKIWSILETKMCTWSQPQMGQSFQSLCRFSCKPETSYKILNNLLFLEILFLAWERIFLTHCSTPLLHSIGPFIDSSWKKFLPYIQFGAE